MRIEHDGSAFVARIRLEERDALKRAGWVWSTLGKRWQTTDEKRVDDFEPFCDASARAVLERWRRTTKRQIELSAATDSDIILPVPQGLAYRGFQKAGIAYALQRKTTLIADPPGLGKTIQAIGVSNGSPHDIRRVLVVCPASLKVNWRREWVKWDVRHLTAGIAATIKEKYQDADGKTKKRAALFWPDTQVVIVNYDILERFEAQIHAVMWDIVVVDEAHYLQTPDSKRTKFTLGFWHKDTRKRVKAIPFRHYRELLTGTPMLGKPMDMWPLIKASDPWGLGKSFITFGDEYCGAYEGAFGRVTTGASNLDKLQRLMRERFMVRRRKMEVLTELPPKTRELIVLPQDGLVKLVDRETGAYARVADMLARYEAVLRGEDPDQTLEEREPFDLDTLMDVLAERYGALAGLPFEEVAQTLGQQEAAAFEELATARRELAVAKVPMIVQQAKNVLNAGEKLIIFCVHKDVARALRESFPGCAYVTGEVPSAKRQAQIDKFQEQDDCTVAVGNINAMGVGYTMTAAQHVDFAELHWVPTDMEQAEDRAWRMGQLNAVLARHFAVEGTMDSRLVEVFIRKMEVIEAALDAPADLHTLM